MGHFYGGNQIQCIDIMVYKKECIFGLLPSFWHGVPKTLKNLSFCYVNEVALRPNLRMGLAAIGVYHVIKGLEHSVIPLTSPNGKRAGN